MDIDNNSLIGSEVKEADTPRWQIGEMAKFMGVSVQTLRYYDEIGLFKPQFRDTFSSYRYYSYSQIYRLANIIFLRKQGYSLEEIKDYLQNVSIEGRLQHLRMQTSDLDHQVLRLQSSSSSLKNRIYFIESSDYKEKMDLIELVDLPERAYVKIGNEQHLFPSELFYYFPTIIHYTPTKTDFGAYVIDKPSFLSFISFSATSGEIMKKFNTVPSGPAYRSFYQGPYESINEKVLQMREVAEREGNKVSPVSVHYNIIDQFVAKDPCEYVTEIHLYLI